MRKTAVLLKVELKFRPSFRLDLELKVSNRLFGETEQENHRRSRLNLHESSATAQGIRI